LVKEGCEEVRVVDLDRQLNKDILVAEARLLKSISKIVSNGYKVLSKVDEKAHTALK
jgi:hypothetical protein